MSQEQRSAISFELHLIRVVKNRSVLTAVIAEVFEGFIEDNCEDVENLWSSGLLNF